MEFKQAILDNGLQVIAELNELAYSTAIGYFVRTGARDETPEVFGGSHFLEHMLFKGTQTRSAEDVNRQLDEMGGMANAFTTDEMTVYYTTVLPELQRAAVELLTDLMRPALRPDDFEMEKQVIIEEINMYADQPPFGLDDRSRELFFENHPLSQSVLGTIESITAMTPEQMRAYFERGYAPGNIVVTACGKVDFDQLVADLTRLTAHWPKVATIPRTKWRPKGASGFQVFESTLATQEYLYQWNLAPAITDSERFAAALLANIVGDDVGSRLFWALVDNGKADNASFSYTDFLDTGVFIRSLCCQPEDFCDNLAIMTDVCHQVEVEGISEEELQRSKNKFLSRTILGSELPRGRLFVVGGEWLQLGEYSSIQEDLRIIRELTLDNLHDVLRRWPLTNPLTTMLGPLTLKEITK